MTITATKYSSANCTGHGNPINFTSDLTTGLEAQALIAHILSSHIAVASPVPLDTSLAVVHAEELEMICLELFSQVVYTLTDSCLDYKLVAPLVGKFNGQCIYS